MMFGIPAYLYERRARLTGYLGGVTGAYLFGRYVVEQIETNLEQVKEDQNAREK